MVCVGVSFPRRHLVGQLDRPHSMGHESEGPKMGSGRRDRRENTCLSRLGGWLRGCLTFHIVSGSKG